MFVPYAVLCRMPTAGSGVALDAPARRVVRLGVAGISAVDIAGEAPRLLACLLVARVVRRVDIVSFGWNRKESGVRAGLGCGTLSCEYSELSSK